MRVSLKWLKELVDIPVPLEELIDRLDMTGTKVETVHVLGERLDGVLIGQVLTKDKHPHADKLSYCTVDIGADEPLKIVCGATNFKAGDKVPVATVGTILTGGVTIKRAKLRGLESQGMMCSARELGVGGDASGLLILPEDAPVGVPFSEWAGLGDTVLELEITPNRPDCLSMVGVAREAGAVFRTAVRTPEWVLTESGSPVGEAVDVQIEDASLCPRYTARVIRGVTIGPSPDWLAERIVASGARPINNVVDVTNYVMFELGQPLHAFDLATIGTAQGRASIAVRTAKPGERLVTLDGQDRELSAETLVIADPCGPVALAGVMGGAATEVSGRTVDILLEAASFDRVSVSRTSRRLGLISEAALRFERGVDPELARRASDRAAALIAEVAGGRVAPGIVDVYPLPAKPIELTLRVDRMNALLGTTLVEEEVRQILSSLGIDVAGEGSVLTCVVPTFRPDLAREIDLYEEVVRIWGMERVASTLPGGRARVGRLTKEQRVHARIGEALRAAGLNEHIGLAFISLTDLERIGWTFGPGEGPVELLNPMSEEQSHLRTTVLPGLLRAVSHNQRHDVPDVHLYEMGTVFKTAEGRKLPRERGVVGGVLAGSWNRPGWNDPAPALDFFDGKGVLETLFDEIDVTNWKMRAAEHPWLQKGRSADVIVAGDVVGWLGEVAPPVLEAYDVSGAVTVFELDVKPLVKAVATDVRYREVPRFPAVKVDVALVVDDSVTAERVGQAIRSAGGPLLESVRLFDVYRDPEGATVRRVREGAKSLAFSLTYRAADRTLTDDEVRSIHERVVRKVCAAVGAEVRS
ncbi:MAG: phenylalanine--tRNA ligase subunit beta [Actinomycetia bacterium]|nr:phenylalanine--tRNA ligase subunit beta [Actinomycetes bacterium]